MADLGKSQLRANQNAGNSPAGVTGYPLGSRGNTYNSLNTQLDQHNFPSRDLLLASKSITPAGSNPPIPSKGSQHQYRLASVSDATFKQSKNIGLISPSITPAGFGATDTAGRGFHYYSLGTTKDSLAGRIARSGGLVGGQALETGQTQGETGGLPIAGTGGTASHYYLRAQDQGCLPTLTYVYWVSTTVSLNSYLGVKPCGGPLINLTILAKF
jgi:hypothetical protein